MTTERKNNDDNGENPHSKEDARKHHSIMYFLRDIKFNTNAKPLNHHKV